MMEFIHSLTEVERSMIIAFVLNGVLVGGTYILIKIDF